MFDVVAIGESLIDFVTEGQNSTGMALLSRNPGGAPANVLAMAAKLGNRTAFIGKVGRDAFGSFLKKTMEDAGVDVSGLIVSPDYPTTLAFVQLDASGDRSFTFYRNQSADIMLQKNEISENLLHSCRILHFGSVSLTAEPSKSSTLYAVTQAKQAGAWISYDPNYRPLLWNEENVARTTMLEAMDLADFVKVSDEELVFLTGETDLAAGARILQKKGMRILVVTRGALGADFFAGDLHGHCDTIRVEVKDTTGAGDAFLGASLHGLLTQSADLDHLCEKTLTKLVCFANIAGALTATGKGAINSMPEVEEICRFL